MALPPVERHPVSRGRRAMDIKEVIRHAVARSIRKGGNRHGESLVVPLPAIELIARELASELEELIEMFRQGGDA
jgi:hypothetical protein